MPVNESIDRALNSPEPMARLRAWVQGCFSRGADKAAVLAALESARQELRQAGREAEEDAVMDVMDFLVGWCGPHMRLDPKEARANGQAAAPDGIRQPALGDGDPVGREG